MLEWLPASVSPLGPDYPSRGEHRASSYGLNGYVIFRAVVIASQEDIFSRGDFRKEERIQRPASTPTVADGRLWFGLPLVTDAPPSNLVTGDNGTVNVNGMRIFSIPRHGRAPSPAPVSWPASVSLPGSINVTFYDGHGESVKLDRLWQLHWRIDWQPPPKRPGLP